MPEYIGKLTAIRAIKNYGIAPINENRRSLGIADDIIKLYDVIGNMPAADVVPVVWCGAATAASAACRNARWKRSIRGLMPIRTAFAIRV